MSREYIIFGLNSEYGTSMHIQLAHLLGIAWLSSEPLKPQEAKKCRRDLGSEPLYPAWPGKTATSTETESASCMAAGPRPQICTEWTPFRRSTHHSFRSSVFLSKKEAKHLPLHQSPFGGL